MESQSIQPASSTSPIIQHEFSVQQVVERVVKMQEIVAKVMHKGKHYGTIPGTKKPTLYQPGSQILAMTFMLRPGFEILRARQEPDFVGYHLCCNLIHIPTGNLVGQGLGACNSQEKRYRGRDAYDLDNTIFKMACKRAMTAAVINATASSDMFTQDLEENNDGANGITLEQKLAIKGKLKRLSWQEAQLVKKLKNAYEIDSIEDLSEQQALATIRSLDRSLQEQDGGTPSSKPPDAAAKEASASPEADPPADDPSQPQQAAASGEQFQPNGNAATSGPQPGSASSPTPAAKSSPVRQLHEKCPDGKKAINPKVLAGIKKVMAERGVSEDTVLVHIDESYYAANLGALTDIQGLQMLEWLASQGTSRKDQDVLATAGQLQRIEDLHTRLNKNSKEEYARLSQAEGKPINPKTISRELAGQYIKNLEFEVDAPPRAAKTSLLGG